MSVNFFTDDEVPFYCILLFLLNKESSARNLFSDAIASPSTLSVGGSVIVSDFGDSYRIYRACKLVLLLLFFFISLRTLLVFISYTPPSPFLFRLESW